MAINESYLTLNQNRDGKKDQARARIRSSTLHARSRWCQIFFGISNLGNLVPEELNLVIGQDFWLQS